MSIEFTPIVSGTDIFFVDEASSESSTDETPSPFNEIVRGLIERVCAIPRVNYSGWSAARSTHALYIYHILHYLNAEFRSQYPFPWYWSEIDTMVLEQPREVITSGIYLIDKGADITGVSRTIWTPATTVIGLMQGLIDILCVVFLNHTTLDPDNTFPHFTLIDFRAVAGLHPDGFRRATEMPEDWTDLNDPAYSYGLMKRGDIVGPWILVDMQNALSAMKWSSESMYSGDVSQGDLTKAVYTYWEEGETQQEWKDRTYADYLTATPVVDAGGLGGMYCTSGSGDGMSVNGRQVKYSFTNKTAVPRGVSFYYTQTGEIHDAGTFFSDQLGFTFEQGGTYHLEDVEETSETTVPMSYYFGVDFDQYLLIPDWGEWRGMIPRRSGRGGAFKIIWNFTNSNE